MKKGILLSFILVLAFATVASAADIKIGGEVRYNYERLDAGGSDDSVHFVTLGLDLETAISEWTSAKVHVRTMDWSDLVVTKAEFQTRFDGIGTLSVGINPDYGTSPFEFFDYADFFFLPSLNQVWSANRRFYYGGYPSPAISFATEKFGGLAGQGFATLYDPDEQEDDTLVAGELTYDLPVLDGATVGFAVDRRSGHSESDDWAFIGKANVGENAMVYGEYANIDGDVGDINPTSLGARAQLGDAVLCGETIFYEGDAVYMIKASLPFHDMTYSATYLFGDADEDMSVLLVDAKVAF